VPTYLASLQQALHTTFAQDDRVFLLGEDLLDPTGGEHSVARGLSTAFPERVLTTPTSEAAIVGVSAGMAMRGLRAVVEIKSGDRLTLCADQMVNHIANFRAIFHGAVSIPVVIRTPMRGGRNRQTAQRQSIEKIYLAIPELRIAAPGHGHDPGEMLAHVILKENRPTLFIEHELLYPEELIVDSEGLRLDHEVELIGYPTAMLRNYRSGEPEITIIAYGGVSRLIVPVMERLRTKGLKILAALPSSIKPLPEETLIDASRRTGKVVVVEEGAEGFNWGSEVAATIYDALHGRLSRPITRLVTGSGDPTDRLRMDGDRREACHHIESAVAKAVAIEAPPC